MYTIRRHVIVCLITFTALPLLASAEPTTIQQLYERVFGDAAKLDPAMVAKVKEAEAGKRHYVDADGDGQPEEVWFIDQALRHRDDMRPVLVRVIDEDGDLLTGHEPDLDSDLYLADWKADGTVNVICDYQDNDGDDDVDEMAFYFPRGSDRLMVWWGDDIGDDNLLWYDTGYTYNQGICQFRTHFGGDEQFCAMTIGLNDAEWLPAFENPFVFYDHDGDGATEEVVRIEGKGPIVHNVRHSFDVDNDGTADGPRDYDVSISGHAPEGLSFDAGYSQHTELRGIPTGSFLSYESTPHYSRETHWAKLMLTWVENDHNIDRDGYRHPNERWEGVIAKGNDLFKQLGGPSCGPLNNRYELATAPQGPMRLYYAPTDQRIHLRGADTMWLEVDADCDRKAEMRYTYEDTNADGYIDTWHFDLDADGTPDDSWTRDDTPFKGIGYTWGEVNAVMAPVLNTVPEQLFSLTFRLREALASLGGAEPDPVWRLLDTGFSAESIPVEVRRNYLNSNECLRYYFDVLKDRLTLALKQRAKDQAVWAQFNPARVQGDLNAMREAVEAAFGLTSPLPALETWRQEKLAAYAQPRTAWAQDWVPPNIGWESDLAGYRAYWGQFDFFGKSRPYLVLPTLKEGNVAYHQEQDWGMDALHVGETCGIGGVTLYVDGTAYPVYSPNGEGDIVWTKRLVAEDPGEATVELLAENVGPKDAPYSVRFTCSALAKRRDSPIEVLVEGGKPEASIELALGLTKLPQETFALDTQVGVMGSWGIQEPAIGWIGMGVVFPKHRFLRHVETPSEHHVILKADLGQPLRYHIQGNWLRGRHFPRCPVLTNWMDELRHTAEVASLED